MRGRNAWKGEGADWVDVKGEKNDFPSVVRVQSTRIRQEIHRDVYEASLEK